MNQRANTPDDFWRHVNKTDGCWLWTSAKQGGRYGRYGAFSIGGRGVRAHRYSWQLHHGAIPPGLHVLHRCDVPLCVRPDHLFLGTHRDNMDDMVTKGRRRSADGAAMWAAKSPEARERFLRSGTATRFKADSARGERSPTAKMTAERVRELRRLRTEGWTFEELGKRFGITGVNACHIVNRRTWQHVE